MATTSVSPEQMEQMEDLFVNAAVPFAISDGVGEVVLANRAVRRLLGHEPQTIAELVGGEAVLQTIFARFDADDTVIRDIAVTSSAGVGLTADAAPVSGADGEPSRIYWSFRPVLTGAVPSAPTFGAIDTLNDADGWIAQLGDEDEISAAHLTAEERQARYELARDFFEHAPPAIHLVSASGVVITANPTELAVLGFADEPEAYVGQHISQIYPDPLTIEDLLSQMSSGEPTVNVRAQLANRAGDIVSVVVYSSSRIVNQTFENTRCIVYPDASANPVNTRLRMFDWPSAS